ncbi:acetate--CoA ligase family protein [soil metagenome]
MGDLSPLLEARSVAVVGASPKPGSVGQQVMAQLERGGYDGRVLAINPKYADMRPTLDEQVDLAVLAVSNRHLEQQVNAVLGAGARSLQIFASCHGEASNGQPLQAWLAERLRGLPVCGGNGMGFLNLTRALRVCGFYQPYELAKGRVTFISHSGSLFSAMLHNQRHQSFNLVISAGNELTLTQGDYVSYAVAQEETRVVAMFTETVRDRTALSEALTKAVEADIPVIVLKVGRTEAGAAAVTTHSAGLAGAYEPFAAFAKAHGVHLVETMDEMMDTIALFDSPRRATSAALGVVHDSGGERTHLIDTASELALELAVLEAPTADRLRGVLDDGLEPVNPVDAWGTGRAPKEVFAECLDALAADLGVGAVAFAVDLTAEEDGATDYADIAVAAAEHSTKPVVVMSHLAGAIDPIQAAVLAAAEVPLLRGTNPGLRALNHLLIHRPPVRPEVPEPPEDLERWQRRLEEGILNDIEALDLLASFGLPIEAMHRVPSRAKAVEMASQLGYPVALKAVGLLHKTEHDGLRLNLRNAESLSSAWRELRTLDLPLAVQRMSPPGIEVALGVINDPQVGPMMMIGTGGVLIELLKDRTLVMPPLDHDRAERALAGLGLYPLLNGYRRSEPVAVARLLDVIVAFSGLAYHLGDRVSSIDVNPMIVSAHGVVAVDAVVF